MDDIKTKHLSLRVSQDFYDRLIRLSDREHRTLSSLIVHMLMSQLETMESCADIIESARTPASPDSPYPGR